MIFTKGTKVTAAPASEPIDAATAKTWLKVESSVSDDDTLVTNLITSARFEIEHATGLAFFTQTVTDVMDDWPAIDEVNNPFGAFHLMRWPVQSVTSITYFDGNGDQQTLSSSNYIVDTTGRFCRIAPAAGTTFPSLRNRINAITITYTAGYSDTADIPEDLKTAMQLKIAQDYYWRSNGIQERRTSADNIILRYNLPVG